jgi:xanthosine utilization system XapX-like protein
MQVAHSVGPMIAGLLMVPLGIGGVMLAYAGLSLASLGGIMPMRRRPARADAHATSMFRSFREGVSFMRQNDVLRWATIIQLVFALLAQPFNQLLPAIAVNTLGVGALELSWMVAAVGIGALGGALVVATSGEFHRRGLLLLGSMLAFGILWAILGLQREVIPALGILALLGFVHQLFNGTHVVTLQLGAPDRLRGRVLGVQTMIFMSTAPFGVLILGTLGTLVGISNVVVVAGIIVAIVAVATFRVPAIRQLRGGDDFAQELGAAADERIEP